MSGGFEKIKRLVKINNVIKSVLNAVAVALVLGAVFMLLDRRNIYELNITLFAAVLGGGALITFLISLFAYRKNDKKLALGIDNELKLNEKVQTMVAFRNENGSVIDVQREDAEQRLGGVKKARMKLVRQGRLTSVLAFVIAAGMLVSTLTLIPQKVEAEEPELEYTMSEYERQLLQNLIEYVERSSAVEREKKNILDELNSLQNYLNDTVKDNAKREKVVATIISVDEAVEEVNFLDDFRKTADERGFKDVSKFADALILLRAGAKPNASMPEAFASITLCLQPVRDDYKGTNAFEDMGELMNEVKAAIATVKNEHVALAATDMFIASISEFYGEILDFCNGAKPQTEIVQQQLDTFFFGNPPYEDAMAGALNLLGVKKVYDSLAQENVNIEVGKYVVNQLMSIFGITSEMLPAGTEDLVEDKNDKEESDIAAPDNDDERVVASGGLGDGNLLFGGNDTIYYPEVEDFVHYGTALAYYQNVIIGAIESGLITDERLIAYYEDYFGILFGSDQAQQ